MTISFNQKARSASKKLGVVALFLATTLAVFFTACKQTSGGEKPTPTPKKHAITFSVEGGNGTLKAKADSIAETVTSPISVEEGKAITFTATPNTNHRVKGWTLDGKPIAEAGTATTYKHTVIKAATVSVSFEAIPPTKHTVTLTQTEHGTVTASPSIPADKQVDKDTVITFTAQADASYKVDKWMVTGSVLEAGTGVDGSSEAKMKITADTSVSAIFIKNTYVITFSVEGGHGTLEAKVDGKEISSGDMVEHGKKVEFTPKAEKGYTLKNWMLNGKDVGATAYFTLVVDEPATVSVSFENNGNPPTPPSVPSVEGGVVLILSPDHLDIKVKARTADGSAIAVEGCTVATLESATKATLTATGTKVVLKGNIIELDCWSNQLTALNVQGLTALQELCCWDNKLTELNVQGLTALQRLVCGGNKFTELNVQGLTALQRLECVGSELTELNVQGLTALQSLNCWGSKLTKLNVQGLTFLEKLYCSSNKLTELNVQGCASLQKLECHRNELAKLDVQGLTALKVLKCYSNNLNAEAMTKLLNALQARDPGDDAKAVLYTEKTGESEGNCKNFAQPEDLKKALDEAKSRNWKLKKLNASGKEVEI